MKNLFSALLIGLLLVFSSCYQQPYPRQVVVQQPVAQQVQTGTDDYGNPTYEVVSQGGQQAVVVYNNDGSQFFMDYVLFNSLLNSGGWGNVYNTYNSNPGYYYNSSLYNRYSGWGHSGYYNYSGGRSVVINHYHGSSFHDYSSSHRYVNTTPRPYRPSSIVNTPNRSAYTPANGGYKPSPAANGGGYKPAPQARQTPAVNPYRPSPAPTPSSYRPSPPRSTPSFTPSKPSGGGYRPSGGGRKH